MHPSQQVDSDPLFYFGTQVRELRLAANWTQQELAVATGYHHTYISKVETGHRRADREFAQAADKALGTGGVLNRLWPMIDRAAHPSWFRDWVGLERQSSVLCTYQITFVPGLLQTPEYARELLKCAQPDISHDRLEELVAARLERQAILEQPDGPELWAVLDHAVLQRKIDSGSVMRAQLARLREAAEHPRITVQVIPAETTAYPGQTGAFVVASFAQGPDALYLETALGGQVIHGGPVENARKLFDELRKETLPRQQSINEIARMERTYGLEQAALAQG